jgi:hypothetical protein
MATTHDIQIRRASRSRVLLSPDHRFSFFSLLYTDLVTYWRQFLCCVFTVVPGDDADGKCNSVRKLE